MECKNQGKTSNVIIRMSHMKAKDVEIFGMYLVVNSNETKFVKEFYKL
jgi:hypothetical protein